MQLKVKLNMVGKIPGENLEGVFQSLSHVSLFASHGLQRTSFLCLPLSPRVCSNSWLLDW